MIPPSLDSPLIEECAPHDQPDDSCMRYRGQAVTHSDVASQLPAMLPRLWSFAMRLTTHTHDAEDLVQRTCVRALEKAGQWQPGTSLIHWLLSIEQSIWFNEVRARKVRSRNGAPWDATQVENVADHTEAGPEGTALHQQIIRAVNALPEPQQAVMLLVAVEGLSYKETAQVLDVPVGTIMSRLARARMRMGALFTKGGGGAK